MDDIFGLSDRQISLRIGEKLKAARLRQNITQQSLAQAADISLSSVKKIEGGEIGSFESLLRVVRILGYLDALQGLVSEDEMSPSEYYAFRNSKTKPRQRAIGHLNDKTETSEW